MSRLVLVQACAPEDERWRKPLGGSAPSAPQAIETWHRLSLARALVVAVRADASVRLVSTGRLVALDPLLRRVGAPVSIELDRGANSLERRNRAFAAGFADGFDQVVWIPGDVPELTAARLADAFDALDEADAVLGPALDGGVYLAGACAPLRFDEDRAARLHAAWSDRHRVARLQPLADVDSRADAQALAGRLKSRRDRGSLLLRAALADLLGPDEAPLTLADALAAYDELDALAAAPSLH